MKISGEIKLFAIALIISVFTGCDSSGGGSGSGSGAEIIPKLNVSLTGITKGENFISFTWTDPSSSIFDYEEIRCTDGTNIINETVEDGVFECEITGLIADTEYKITLHAVYSDNTIVEDKVIFAKTTVLGAGTSDFILISNAEELNNVRNDLNENYLQVADIDLTAYRSGTGWEPIGDAPSPFTGVFIGNGYEITGLVIDNDTKPTVGFFGSIMTSKISNVKIKNCEINGGNISSGSNIVGGLVGASYESIISTCYSTGSVNGGNSSNDIFVGGLVGKSNKSTISICYSTGSVNGGTTTYGENNIGGLVGNSMESTISTCYSTVLVNGGTSSHSDAIGGLVGSNYTAIISGCFATGLVYGGNSDNNSVGGLVGKNYLNSTINGCYATGSVDGGNFLTYGHGHIVGGLIGSHKFATVSNCYSTGSVDGGIASGYSYNLVGGLVGENSNAPILYSYTTCTVNGGTAGDHGTNIAGGLLGTNSSSTITKSYWNIDIYPSSNGGTGLTTDPMKDAANVDTNYSGWDFSTIWDIDATGVINDGYPYLRDMP